MNASEIAEHPFLEGMEWKHLEALAEFAMPTRFAAGELIFREGDIANRFYLIKSGRVELGVSTGDGQFLAQTIGGGDVLGWSWLLPPYKWHFDARAVESTEAIFLYGTMLRERCETDHDLGYELMRRVAAVMVRRLQIARDQLLGRLSS
jgi:CRP/FNR family transcriptional regulator, cyclic AMP receptor protein